MENNTKTDNIGTTESTPATINKEKSELWKRKIGVLWVREGKSGNKFLSGELELEGKGGPKIRILILKNNAKREEKYPDYEIFLDKSEIAKDVF